MQETFRGREVYDAQLTVETDSTGQEILDATGSFVQVQNTIVEFEMLPLNRLGYIIYLLFIIIEHEENQIMSDSI